MNKIRFYFVFFLSLFYVMVVSATTYYVSNSGNDSYIATQAQSLATPWQTIQKAALMVVAGDVVLVRSGTYSGDIRFRISGTVTLPITFKAYQGENPIIDLNGGWPADEGGVSGWWFGVVSMLSDYNVIDGFEIRNGTSAARLVGGGQGVAINGNYNTVRNCIVHNIQDAGMHLRGSYTTIDGNTVYDACLNKLNNYPGVNWGSGISINGSNNGILLTGNVIRNNIVHNVWGEGIYGYYGISNTLMEGNIVYNYFAVGMGLSGSKNGIIRNNLVYSPSDSPANLAGWGGLCVVNDNQSTISDTCTNNLVCNNFVYGSNIVIDRLLAATTSQLIDTHIYNNTVINPAGNPINLGGTQTSTIAKNNIFVGLWNNQLYASVAASSNNYWLTNPPTGFGLSSISDIIGDASVYLVKSPGSASAGQLTKEWFRLTYDSPARNNGVTLSDVPTDAFGNIRDAISPCISAFEYTNCVNNPGFTTNTANWSIELSFPATATIASVSQTGYDGNACKTTITNPGTALSYIQLKQNIPIVSGKIYSVKFKASAAANKTIGILFQQLGSPYTTYWSNSSINLTTTPTTYGPYTFVCSSTDVSANYKFLLGGNSTAVWIDDVEISETSNFVNNPTFDTNTTPWSVEVSSPASAGIASVSQTGYAGNACKTTITNPGTASYYIQLKQNIPIVNGKNYSVNFKASAAANRTIGISFQELGSPYTTYWSQSSINLTTTPTTYGPYTFVCTTTDSTENFKFLLGGSITAVWIDDVEISESTSPTLAPKLITSDEKITNDKSIRLFPNPTSDYVTINFDKKSVTELAQITIVDISGKIVYKTHVSQISNLRLSTNQFVKGLYFVEIIRGSDRYTSKLVIQ